jgi:cytochrome P450
VCAEPLTLEDGWHVLLQAAEGSDRLTEREVLTLCKLAVIAGNDLTTQALALTLNCLLENPEQMRLLAKDLSLAANAFEESLRFNGPVIYLQRKALRDVEVAGIKVPVGCLVTSVVSSANHDETVFDKPDVFDIRRKIPRILSMSSGNHQCIGQPLARLEARVAFEEWFARVSSFEREGRPDLVGSLGLRGFKKLPVRFQRRPATVATVAQANSHLSWPSSSAMYRALVGCSQNAELEKARADAEAAKTELAAGG